ncbi:MAG: DUF1549 domain-containing protein [Saprospiraceae bacterium]
MLPFFSHWIFDLTGKFHPLLVHFPIGLLIGAFILEGVARFQKQENKYVGMVYLGTVAAFIAAIMGQLLAQSGEYQGDLINQHQYLGWATVALSMLTTLAYWNRANLPKKIPFIALGCTCICLSFAGHFGATITHGTDYLKINTTESSSHLGNAINIQKWTNQDSFSTAELANLNLEVRAIFAHHCYQCHSTAKRKGGLALDHEAGVFSGGDSGQILVKGTAAKSEIIRRLKLPRSHEEAMPQKGKVLPPNAIDLISLWIDKGAYWAAKDLKVFREAPIALSKPNIPPATDEFDHPIDRFVNQYFKANNIQWRTPIDDSRFIRRAYLDAIGILPKPETVNQFVQDTVPNKRRALIKKLLADKENYTQHWLSFWNDLLRNDYSGPGFITNGRKQITNWLYQSLMEGKPYNQMVEELINPTQESEGFIQGIQWRGVVNASQRVELQAAQNISQSLLGLNLKCASCHNSFVNNLTLDQAYGFANIFADSTLEIYRCDKPTGRYTGTAFIYPELGEVMADSLVDRLRQLAKIISQPKNGRLYRTVVNRFWDKLFGRGIIAPVDEMDKLPWNQDLLDWLAADFIDNGYSIPHLLETIMTSKVYQLPAINYDSPYYIASEKFVFQGPTPRRLTAEQFADALSQTINPLYYGVAYLPNNPPFPAQWIWFQDRLLDRNSLPQPGERFFRKSFKLDTTKPIQSATVIVTADHSFECYFNEQKIGQGADWREVQRYSIPITTIHSENIIAVKGTNDGTLPNPAGLLFALRITYTDGSEQYVYSDKSWATTNIKPTDNWTNLNFEATDWKSVSRKNANHAHWGKLVDFAYENKSNSSDFARASLVKLDPFMKTLGRPTRENVATTREGNATLLQAMMLTNNDFLYQHIQEGATKLLAATDNDLEVLVNHFYQNTLGRIPNQKEQSTILKLLDSQSKQEVVEDLIWSVIILPEFQFL